MFFLACIFLIQSAVLPAVNELFKQDCENYSSDMELSKINNPAKNLVNLCELDFDGNYMVKTKVISLNVIILYVRLRATL